MAQTVGFSRALATVRRTVAARRDVKRRARAVRIPPCSPCIVCCKNKKQHPAGCCPWRRRWDSNPRDIAVKLILSNLPHWMQDGISGQYWLVRSQILSDVCKQKRHKHGINHVSTTESKKSPFLPQNDTFLEKMQDRMQDNPKGNTPCHSADLRVQAKLF